MTNQVPNNILDQDVKVLPGGEKPTVINQKLVIRPPHRDIVEVVDWRGALRSAEAYIPRYVALYDIYTDIWLDAHLSSVANKRIMGVTKADWRFVNADEKPVEALTALIDSPAFKTVLKCIVLAKLEGYRMVECNYINGKFTVYVVPPKHMRPRTGIVSFEQQEDRGINIREGVFAQTVMEIGEINNLGLFASAAQYVIFKRGVVSDWANFIEIFGQPLIDAEWDGMDTNQRIQLEEALDKMGNGGKITRPAGTKITLVENKANANGDLQNHFVSQMNREISKVILGQTETTEASTSSGYAQSKTHEDVENDINMTDLSDAKTLLNTRFLEILKNIGVPGIDGGKFIIAGEGEESISLKDNLEMDIALVTDLKLPVDDDYFYEKYKLPKPANYAALKKAALDAANAQMVDLEGNPLKPNPASTPPVSTPKNDKNPDSQNDKTSGKPGKLKKLFLEYRHFFA